MSYLYKVLSELCAERNITAYRMCKDVGIQPSIMTDLKMGRRSSVKAETAEKIASYFGVTVGYLLGTDKIKKSPAEIGERSIGDSELKFALWGDCDEIDEDDLNDVKRYAAFVRERKRDKQK